MKYKLLCSYGPYDGNTYLDIEVSPDWNNDELRMIMNIVRVATQNGPYTSIDLVCVWDDKNETGSP